jgi:5-hydroxyisourate hydrolase
VSLSTHVLDATTGRPAAGLEVSLHRRADDGWEYVVTGTTDDDGRIPALGEPSAGEHRLTFATGAWFARRDQQTFYPQVDVTFEITDAAAHHHVPLLLSPFAYSTYRGS